jgi:predicted transcriptional regulator
MDFIKKRYPLMAVIITVASIIIWVGKEEWAYLVIGASITIEFLRESTTMPLWAILLLIITPVSLSILWDLWKKKINIVILSKEESVIVKIFQELKENCHLTPSHIIGDVNLATHEVRKILVKLKKYGVLEEVEWNDENQEMGYQITERGLLT